MNIKYWVYYWMKKSIQFLFENLEANVWHFCLKNETINQLSKCQTIN